MLRSRAIWAWPRWMIPGRPPSRRLLASQDFGGVEKIKLVDCPLVEERPQGLGPAFHQEALDLAGPQLLQQGRKRDPAGVGGQHQDLGAPRLKGADRIPAPGWWWPPRWGPGSPGAAAGTSGAGAAGCPGRPDGSRPGPAPGPPGGELGVVGQHRADPHDDGVHPVPQAVPQARAASPVSHWLSPPTVAILPSREQAALAMTQGRPVLPGAARLHSSAGPRPPAAPHAPPPPGPPGTRPRRR